MRLAIFIFMFATSVTSAAELKIVLWNSERMFDVAAVARRAGDLRQFGQEYRDADIVLLDEVTSLEVVNAIRDRMGYRGFHTACSDFAQDDFDTFDSLEVGIISRFPLAHVLEYDPTPDNTGAPGEPLEEPLVNVGVPGIDDAVPSRGYLTADVPQLGVTLVVTHLKSARGRTGAEDHDNARQRELVAASIARFVADKLKANTAATVLVAGDMNVGETDMSKNGYRLEEDYYDRRQGDLYDDTNAIFTAGLIGGLHMASLTIALGQETYDNPQFAGAGPIDRMYVAGRQSGDFTLATRSSETFGSDHYAISTRFLFRGSVPQRDIAELPPAAAPPGVRIAALLPNPSGQDEGQEWVELVNTSEKAMELAGWQLRDKAGHAVSLSGSIAAAATLKVSLEAGQMPLNNSGDTIELSDAEGRVVHRARYSSNQVLPGRAVSFAD